MSRKGWKASMDCLHLPQEDVPANLGAQIQMMKDRRKDCYRTHPDWVMINYLEGDFPLVVEHSDNYDVWAKGMYDEWVESWHKEGYGHQLIDTYGSASFDYWEYATFISRANALCVLGRYDDALAAYDRAIKTYADASYIDSDDKKSMQFPPRLGAGRVEYLLAGSLDDVQSSNHYINALSAFTSLRNDMLALNADCSDICSHECILTLVGLTRCCDGHDRLAMLESALDLSRSTLDHPTSVYSTYSLEDRMLDRLYLLSELAAGAGGDKQETYLRQAAELLAGLTALDQSACRACNVWSRKIIMARYYATLAQCGSEEEGRAALARAVELYRENSVNAGQEAFVYDMAKDAEAALGSLLCREVELGYCDDEAATLEEALKHFDAALGQTGQNALPSRKAAIMTGKADALRLKAANMSEPERSAIIKEAIGLLKDAAQMCPPGSYLQTWAAIRASQAKIMRELAKNEGNPAKAAAMLDQALLAMKDRQKVLTEEFSFAAYNEAKKWMADVTAQRDSKKSSHSTSEGGN
ncbi:MAG: hypothetical protein WC360_03290 [Opitutales bacterium]